MRRLKAIDLYCGIGGWSLGLELSGVRVVEAIDISPTAVETYAKNLGDSVRKCDMRSLEHASLPSEVDVIVGSPPCTQFSYSNKGGSGDLVDGMVDLRAFLTVVAHVQPRFWIMENVPRVAKIVEAEMSNGGELVEFAHLVESMLVVDLSEFGLPQRRKRCIIGRFPEGLLLSYRERTPSLTIRDVINSFGTEYYEDMMYGTRVPLDKLSDHIVENPLTDEEVRLNVEAKAHHPVYNGMRFPDDLDRPARTLTATCTKVSRESIVIEDNRGTDDFRRLTIRERASLQGFPGTFGFFAPSYTAKIQMIGNALPPLFSYYVGCALRGVSTGRLRHPWERKQIAFSQECPPETVPRTAIHRFPDRRRFRAAIPGLRFNSGMRFQMSNSFDDDSPKWIVDFRYGTPKDVRVIGLEARTLSMLADDQVVVEELATLDVAGASLARALVDSDPHWSLQQAWLHRRLGIGPFEVVDELGRLGEGVGQRIGEVDSAVVWERLRRVLTASLLAGESLIGQGKLTERRSQIYAGMIVGCWFNNILMPGCASERNGGGRMWSKEQATVSQG